VSGAITFSKRGFREMGAAVVARREVLCVIHRKFIFIFCVFKRGVLFSLFSLI